MRIGFLIRSKFSACPTRVWTLHSGNSQATPETFAAGDGHRGRISEPTGPGFFDEVGGGLLVLGAPGAGKTTVLLQLAREPLDRAERDPEQPVPVAALSMASAACVLAAEARPPNHSR